MITSCAEGKPEENLEASWVFLVTGTVTPLHKKGHLVEKQNPSVHQSSEAQKKSKIKKCHDALMFYHQ